jgi:hypothetical protein
MSRSLEVTVRSIVLSGARAGLIVLLTAGLLSLPAMAAGAASVGMIVTADDAMLSNLSATQGADLYPGDTLLTHPGGYLRMALGSSQVYLMSSTEATLQQRSGVVQAKVARGTLDFSTTEPNQFEVETALGVIRGVGAGQVYGQVAVLSPSSIEISAYEGSLMMSGIDGQERTVAPGETYEASLDGGAAVNDVGVRGVGQGHGIRWKRVAAVAWVVGGAGVAALLIYRKTTESCSTINCR